MGYGLTSELGGEPSDNTRDPSRAAFEPEQREWASLLLGLYQALMILFPAPDRQWLWLHQPNLGVPFQGIAPIERLRDDELEGLRVVCHHLDAVSQGTLND
ncbi:MAG: antitoxin Xre/MbcA/ParS toxin-binding domain-containing protein [Pseudomonadota bacterium]